MPCQQAKFHQARMSKAQARYLSAIRTLAQVRCLFGDKAYNSAADEASLLAETAVRVIPIRKAKMASHAWFLDEIVLRLYRHTIETINSQ